MSTFIDAEEPSFALFSFVSELAGECEKLEMQISQMRSEIEQHRAQVLTLTLALALTLTWSSIMLSGHAHHAPPNVAYRSSSRHSSAAAGRG